MSFKCRHLLVSLLLAVAALALVHGPVSAAPPPHLNPPTVSCNGQTASSITLHICGDAITGAPAGVSVAVAVFNGSYDHQDYPTSVCEVSLSGVPDCSRWKLVSGNLCQDVLIGISAVRGCGEAPDCVLDLQCDTDYIFWVKAHNDPHGLNGTQFNDVDGVVCRTAPCNPGGCTLTWGYWKNHGPGDCQSGNNSNEWDATSLTIGSQSLSDAELCAILHDAPKACGKGGGSNGGANAVLILEHQLIAAQLNKANGAIDCAFANTAIATANGLLSGNENACVGASTALGQQMIEAAGTLAAYNSDLCDCPNTVSPVANPEAVTETKPSSWGKLKLIYR